MCEMNNFYTYAYLREDGTPYYIGKGKGKRAGFKWGGRIRPPKDLSRILFLKKNLTEKEAFKHEIYMIALLGRKDLGTGILRNRTDGGEGASGAVVSEETRNKMSEAKKKMSDKTKRKLSEASKGRTRSVEIRNKMSEAHKGDRNSAFGKKWWNDSCGNTKLMVECPGEGWKLGRK